MNETGTTPAPDQSMAEQHTVKVLLEQDDNVLLVTERGTPDEAVQFGGEGRQWRKPPGLGLPGGKVEGTLEEILEGIRKQMRYRGIPERQFTMPLKRLRRLGNVRITLTAVKEVLEETGILVMPNKLEQWQSDPERDTVWLCRAKVVHHGDTTRGGDAKIVEVAWHPVGRLPERTYRRTRDMVRHSLLGGERS